MASLLGGARRSNQPQIPLPESHLRIQTSVQGRARPIGWGRVRVSANILLTANFNAYLVPQVGAGSGATHAGKGGSYIGGGKGAAGINITWTWNYSVTLILGFGNAQVSDIVQVFSGPSSASFSGPGAPSNSGLNNTSAVGNASGAAGGTLFHGGYTQTTWAYTDSTDPTQSLAYRGEAYLAFGPMYLGSNASIPNYSFEIDMQIGFDIPALGPDANPKDVITDYLTNADYGVPGWSTALLADLSDFQLYCRAASLLVSFTEGQQRPASSFLQEFASVLNVDYRWSSGKLSVIPYTSFSQSGNGYTWTAPTTPQYDLTADDFIDLDGGASGSPTHILVHSKPRSKIINHFRLEYLPRENFYNPWVIDHIDEGSIDNFGLERIGDVTPAHYFCLDQAASASVAFMAARAAIRKDYTFRVGRRFIRLDPMDIVTLTDVTTGLNRTPVRIREITEGADKTLTIQAEEYPILAGPPAFGNLARANSILDFGADPGAVVTPIFFEPPDSLAGGLYIWCAVCGANAALWGGADVYVANDDMNYSSVGRINGPARMGVLSATLSYITPAVSGPTIDATNTLSVDLTESAGSLLSGSDQDFAALSTLCYVDGEYVAYHTAMLTGASKYNLAPLSRGAYGTSPASHALGSKFARLDDKIFAIPFRQDQIGSTIYIKFVSFNIFGGGRQDLATVGVYPYKITGSALASPLPNVTNVRTVFEASVTKIWWDEVKDFRTVSYEVRKGQTYAGSTLVGVLAHPPVVAFGDDVYWISAYAQPVSDLIVRSATPSTIAVAGSVITKNVILGLDETASHWPGVFTNTAVDSNGLRLAGAENILAQSNVLSEVDVLNAGGIALSGYYTSAQIIDIGRVTTMLASASWVGTGVPVGQNILAIADVLANLDMLGAASAVFIDVHPEIRIGQPSGGSPAWGAWQKFVPGNYVGRYAQFRLALTTQDPKTIAYALAFSWQVSVEPRIDHYSGQSVPATGLALTFTPDTLAGGAAQVAAPFNGGPNSGNLPAVSVSWQNNSGDTLQISSLTKAGCTVTILNGGVGVLRNNVNIIVEGY